MAKRILSQTQNAAADTEIFSVKNFILAGPRKVKARGPVSSKFVFEGVVIIMCLRGKGRIRINYKEIEISRNQLVLVMPYQIVTPLSHDEDTFVAGLFIGADYLVEVPVVNTDFDRIMKFSNYPVVTLDDKQMENLMELHSVILTRYNNLEKPYSRACIKALMYGFLAEIGSIAADNKSEIVPTVPTRQERITNDFFRLLISEFRQHRLVSYYADKMCYTPKYLSTVVKNVTGYTIQDWINEIVVMHIKNQLRTTDKTVLEISEEMNFSNPSFFGRFFKQYAGMTPQQFRFG